jgi:MEMO1 family protein
MTIEIRILCKQRVISDPNRDDTFLEMPGGQIQGMQLSDWDGIISFLRVVVVLYLWKGRYMIQSRLMMKGVWIMIACLLTAWLGAESSAGVRQPAVSGSWYSDSPEKLSRDVDRYLKEADSAEVTGNIKGIVVPHAGFVFSGSVAAHAYKLLQGQQYDSVILIGNAHRVGFKGAALDGSDAYRTPLGDVPVDTEIVQALSSPEHKVVIDSKPHRHEHSLESQIPFLQRTLKEGFTIVPILFGYEPGPAFEVIVNAITKIAEKKSILLIASTDLTHFPSCEDSHRIDRVTVEMIASMDIDKLKNWERSEMSKGIRGLDCVMCGNTAVFSVIESARRLGADKGFVLDCANSGDVAMGEKSRVVGYGAVVFMDCDRGEKGNPVKTAKKSGKSLSDTEHRLLLALSRHVLDTYVQTGTSPVVKSDTERFNQKQGVFVTLKIHDQLRGCIGYIMPRTSLHQAVVENTVNACAHDPRFTRVTPSELEDIDIEISVLSVPEKVVSTESIELGRHGIILKKGNRHSVFLPQVAPEQGWTLEETLRHLSYKAGLNPDEWRNNAEFEVFEADVFSEKEMGRQKYDAK